MPDKNLRNENIRVAASLPGLSDHIKIDVNNPSEKAYWYIKFNIALDKAYVNKDTTNVTDTEGYIMRTYIYYDETENLIVVVPLDSYEQDRYYLLNISRDVRSKNGQKLKREIHILFKLIDHKIGEFKILKATANVPKARPRPANYDAIQKKRRGEGGQKRAERKQPEHKQPKTKIYSFEKDSNPHTSETPLPYANIRINIVPAIVGLATIFASLFIGNTILIIVCLIVCFAGIGITLYGIIKADARSNISYNRGVSSFNNEKYKKAEICFNKALAANEYNEMAERALDKLSFYL